MPGRSRPTWSRRTSRRMVRTGNGGRTSPTSGQRRAGFTSRSCWISSPAVSLAGPRVIAWSVISR